MLAFPTFTYISFWNFEHKIYKFSSLYDKCENIYDKEKKKTQPFI